MPIQGTNVKFSFGGGFDFMNYRDTIKNPRESFSDFCPVCLCRLYWPGFTHVWMIVRRSDILNVPENTTRPILMHKDCAARYEVTKRLLISAGTIPKDEPVIASQFESLMDEMQLFGKAFGQAAKSANALSQSFRDYETFF